MGEMSIISDEIARLNAGESVPTYEMTRAPDRRPLTGELRYIMPMAPAPWEPLAAMVPLGPIPIIWNGNEWVSFIDHA